jgi:DNA-binding transcriptional MocR family regulator
LTYLSTSSLSALALKELLSSPEVPTLLFRNRQRLSDSFALFSECFKRLNVEYISPTNGLFVFAKLGQGLATQEEEDSFFDKLLQNGVSVSRGRLYDKQSKEYGWARVTIAVRADLANLAVERLTKILE